MLITGVMAVTFLLIGCTSGQKEQLEVTGGEPVIYQCETGEQIVARFYSLSDSSLDFVKLSLPDNKKYTLPRVISASGVRYTDDRDIVFWMKGETAFVQKRDQNGEWQMLYDNCRIVASRPE